MALFSERRFSMRRREFIALAAALWLCIALGTAMAADAEKPTIAAICKQCHAPEKGVLRGTLGNVSMKARTIQLQVGPAVWLVKFEDETKLTGAEALNEIPSDKEIAIAIFEKDGDLYASAVSVKPPASIPEEKLIKLEALVASMEAKGEFVLVDSRPGPRYLEGHIPGAISIFDGEFDKNLDKLPKQKDTLLIFYCGGVT